MLGGRSFPSEGPAFSIRVVNCVTSMLMSILLRRAFASKWMIPALTVFVALVVRLWFIHRWPDAYQFDAYQRWAGREHLYIQVWLPATQVAVWLTAKVGGTMMTVRYVFAAWSAITLGMGSILCAQLAGRRGAWFFLPMAVFGPFIVWSTVPYQETTLLFFLFSALVIGRKYPKAGDVVMGALAFVRYEGWPLIIVHCLLRRTWTSLLALWGMATWGAIKWLDLMTPYASSPDSFADWNDIGDSLNAADIVRLFRRLWVMIESAGTAWIVVSAVAFLIVRRRSLQREHWMLLIAFAGQCAATIGWLLSLGVAFSRMTVLPSLFMGVLMACAYAYAWDKTSRNLRVASIVSLVLLSAWTLRDAKIDQRHLSKVTRWDRRLVRTINKCPEDTWAIVPRQHGGPRKRHDACEVVQGLTSLIAGRDFDCTTWSWGGPEATLKASWNKEKKKYNIVRLSGVRSEQCPY